ncbi:MAG: diacylglycerol kinase [Cyanobacteria bacterium P01_D01_bin.36]
MKRLWSAFLNSVDGLISAWRDEPAFRQEVVFAVLFIPIALFIAPDAVSMALMIGAIFVVLIIELINTAVESVVDRVGLHRDKLAKKAKDAASAAVLVAIVNAVIVWAIVLL